MRKKWEIEGYLEETDGALLIDGIPATNFLEDSGSPVFVFSANRIRHNISRLKKIDNVIDCDLKICYAAKANSDHQILQTVRDSGIDIEVNSGGELKMALEAGFLGNQIIFNGTSKVEDEIELAIKSDIYSIQADSIFEVELIEKVAKRLKASARVSLRLVPGVESKTHSGLQTALFTSKFGMMPDEAISALNRWTSSSEAINITGIHVHIGSQNPSVEPYVQAFEVIAATLERISKETNARPSHINIGGGFPVNYLRDDSHSHLINEDQQNLLGADYEPADAIRAAWGRFVEILEMRNIIDMIEGVEMLIEPGRSVIADAGTCLTTVRNIKQRPTGASAEDSHDPDSEPLDHEHWLLTDAGFNILLSMETYKWYYHLIHATRADEEHDFPYKVAGPLCDGGDVYFDIEGERRLPDHRYLPARVRANDLLALFNAGAYTVSQMFPYNGRELPGIVLVDPKSDRS